MVYNQIKLKWIKYQINIKILLIFKYINSSKKTKKPVNINKNSEKVFLKLKLISNK